MSRRTHEREHRRRPGPFGLATSFLAVALVASAAELMGPLVPPPAVGPPAPEVVASPSPAPEVEPWEAIEMQERTIEPGQRRQISLQTGESFAGSAIDIPVLVARGERRGRTLCMTAGVHGDELNGIEIVRQVFADILPSAVHGMLVGYPVVNMHGFRASSRYLPDRRDLNRFFPGHPRGSSASRIANSLFQALLETCDALVDFHTGSFHRTNLPQIRADLSNERTVTLARSFGIGVVVHSYGMRGTLRRAATEAGLPAITYEAGEPMRFAQREIEQGVTGVRNLMAAMGMYDGDAYLTEPDDVYHRSRWVRVNEGGIFLTGRRVGEVVGEGDVLGTVTDPVSNEQSTVRAPFAGRIIGMALPQVVIPGFATFHLGMAPIEGEAEPSGGEEQTPDDLDAIELPE